MLCRSIVLNYKGRFSSFIRVLYDTHIPTKHPFAPFDRQSTNQTNQNKIEHWIHATSPNILHVTLKLSLRGPSIVADRPVLLRFLYLIQLLSVFRKHLVIGQFIFSLFFFGHYLVSIFTAFGLYIYCNGPNVPNYRIGPDCWDRP